MQNHRWRWYKVKCVNALSGLYLISTHSTMTSICRSLECVNALSGLYLISTRNGRMVIRSYHVSMPSRAYTSFLPERSLMMTSYDLIVSMPSRAYTSFLRSPFKNLDFMRFSEPVFAGIYQNILITAVFRAC